MKAKPEGSLTGSFLHRQFKMTVLILFLSLFTEQGFAAICDDFNALADIGVLGQADFDYGNNSVINGNNISGNGNTPTPLGISQTVNLTFPPLVPALFPATGTTNLNQPNPASVSAGSYGRISFGSNAANPVLKFTGGNYFIRELVLSNSTAVQFAPGNYFIEKFDAGNTGIVSILPAGQVKIYIKQTFKMGNQSKINVLGKTGNLIVYLYNAADFQIGNGDNSDSDSEFNGIIYSPFANTDIDFGNNNTVTGAILSAGEVDVGNNTQFDYSASVQAEVIEALGCSPANHLRIEHDGSGFINQAELVGVKICANTACSSFLGFQNSASITLSSVPDVNASWSVNPVPTVNGVASTNFTATSANTYSLKISSFKIAGITQSGYTVKCFNTATSVLNDCNMVISTSVDHYAITHTGPGVTCEAQSITITAHTASHVPVAPSSTTKIFLSTPLVPNDGWALRNGSGVFTAPDQYTFNGVETEVQFWLKKTTAASMDIDVTDLTASDPDDGGAEDRVLEFRDTGLRFYADLLPDGSYSLIGNQIAGKSSSLAPGSQSLILRAVQKNTDTGACEARLKNTTHTVQMATLCIDPGSCKCIDLTSCANASAVLSITNAGGVSRAIDVNGEPVVLSFDNSGYASFSLNYRDAGRIALNASLSLSAIAPDPAITLTGTSNSFVVRPFGFDIDSGLQRANDWLNGSLDGIGPSGVINNSWAQDISGSRFVKAGDSFNITLRSLLWSAADDLDNNGIPDLGANLTDNGLTPNFGEEIAPELVVISHAKKLPAGAGTVNGNLSGGLTINFSGGNGSASSSISWNEVGIIDLIASLNSGSYLASGASVATTQQNFGRFYPAQFVLSGGSVNNRIALGGGSSFTYMDESFELNYTLTAQNRAGFPTSNYSGVFALLNTAAELHYGAVDTTQALNLGGRLTTGAPLMSWSSGSAVIVDTVNIVRNPAPDGPYLVDIGVAPADEDGVILQSYNLDVDGTGTPLQDHGLIATTQVRFGRIELANTFGSELVTLNMPMQAQYFDGANFILNTDDGLTALTTASLILSSAVETGQTDGDVQVLTGKTSVASILNSPLVAGNAGLSFCPPGNPACTAESGNAGFIDVTLDLSTLPYLQFDWDGNGTNDDPAARATFGIFSGNSRQIYYRQIFQ